MAVEDEDRLDIRVVTANSIDAIAEITGRDRGDLWDAYTKAVDQGTSLHIFINHQGFNNEKQIVNSWQKGECFYTERGSHMVCLIHNQASKHVVSQGAHKPCAAVDPW